MLPPVTSTTDAKKDVLVQRKDTMQPLRRKDAAINLSEVQAEQDESGS